MSLSISFSFFAEEKLPLLVTWLKQPHVAEWWKAPVTAEEITEKYAPRCQSDSEVRMWNILIADEPVGIIQTGTPEAYCQAPVNSGGMDILIGRPDLIGRGIGSEIIRTFVERHIFGQLGSSHCFADPVAKNLRSVRAFEKAGFKAVKTAVVDGDELAILQTTRPDKSA